MKATIYRHNISEDEGRWNVATAKQKLSLLLRAARKSPQIIYNRSEPVVAVVSFEKFIATEAVLQHRTLFNLFEEARGILRKISYTLELPQRLDRRVERL